ncbi:PAS domain S-box protein [Inquilinus sp. KBS0705]|nr:PAS domain S-box protein [Inquilinus sp. KBS0705]
MKRWLARYEHLIKGKLLPHLNDAETELDYWKDQLFLNFLIYCLPLSLIAAVPGIYLSFRDGLIAVGITDILSVLLLVFITFSNKLSLKKRKVLITALFYVLAVVLINNLGYVGPGIFYLFAITIIISLISPVLYAYRSILTNIAILICFYFVIEYRLFNSMLIKQYSGAAWLAFSSNLVFLSLVFVALINKIFKSLQITIINKSNLQERYKNIFDKSPLPMWLFDTETLYFLDVNDAAVRHYGYSKSEFLAMTIRDIRPTEQVASVEDLVKKNKELNIFFDGHSQHIKKNGDYIYVKIESNPLHLDGRDIRLVLATDITDSLADELEIFNANLKIKESETNLKAIFESSTDGFVLLDPACRIKLFNSKAQEFMTFNKELTEFETGKIIFDFVEPSRRPYFHNLINRVYNGEIIDYDRKHRKTNELVYWIRYTLTPVYSDGKVTGVCITGRDVTARKIYLKTVEDQNKIFREISWMQSHMVRAPLARIMGLITLFKNATSETEKDEIFNYLTISTNELDDIIRQISHKSNDVIEKQPVFEDVAGVKKAS